MLRRRVPKTFAGQSPASPQKPVPEPTEVTLISDSTGSLGDHVLQAVFTQFPPHSFTLTRINFVNNDEALRDCLEALKHARGIVVHATIYEQFKRRIEALCKTRKLPVYDLTGPIMDFITRGSGRKPEIRYARLHELGSTYFRRIEAIEFAIEHDDGGSLRTLHQADVVLTGVSRTTKTPTSMVLAVQGYRAANVPLVHGIDPPRELLHLNSERIVCLTLHPTYLVSIRERRMQDRLKHGDDYAEERSVQREILWARKLAEERGWALIDVTGLAVEETAARVIKVMSEKLKIRNWGNPH